MTREELLPTILYRRCAIHDLAHPMHGRQGRIVHLCAIRNQLSVAIVNQGSLEGVAELNAEQVRRVDGSVR